MAYAIQQVKFPLDEGETIHGKPEFMTILRSSDWDTVLRHWTMCCSGVLDANDVEMPHEFDRNEFAHLRGVFYRIIAVDDDQKVPDVTWQPES